LNKNKSIWLLTPVFGIIIFFVLYIIAALYYPGGSQADRDAKGFSWANNYWCNLLSKESINGQYNRARPIATAAMFVLGLSLALFWFQFPRYIKLGNFARCLFQYSGIISMAIPCFLFSYLDHDLVINLASLFGLIAVAGSFVGLYKNKWVGLFVFGIANLLLVALNNYVYYTGRWIVFLPVIQKISFVAFLFWICCIDIKLYQTRTYEAII
jgi:hypothetical protein